jgi:hypothetical protein
MIGECQQFAMTLFQIHFDEKDGESGLMKCVWETILLEEVQNINFTELRMQVPTTQFTRAMPNSRKVTQRSRIELNDYDVLTFVRVGTFSTIPFRDRDRDREQVRKSVSPSVRKSVNHMNDSVLLILPLQIDQLSHITALLTNLDFNGAITSSSVHSIISVLINLF